MGEFFLRFLNVSISASGFILVILLLRLLLSLIGKNTNAPRIPRFVYVGIWAVLGLRLLLPLTIESPLSLGTGLQIKLSERTVAGEMIDSQEAKSLYDADSDVISYDAETYIAPQITGRITAIGENLNGVLAEKTKPTIGSSVDPTQVYIFVGEIVWLIGIVAVLVYSIVGYIVLRIRLREAVPYKTDKRLGKVRIMESDRISSPFILGVINPVIYLPSSLIVGDTANGMGTNDSEMGYILDHEISHLKRGDNVWKVLGMIVLAIHWFNPLVWVSYVFLCKDIEFACDEKVVSTMDIKNRKKYADTLLRCGMRKQVVLSCPLAFGEVSVGSRIKSVLNYKKPALWIIIASVVVCAVLAVLFLTNPIKKSEISGMVMPESEKNEENFTETNVADTDGERDIFDSDENNDPPIKVLKHKFTDERGFNDASEIRLYSDGTFDFSESYTSSRRIVGYWDIQDGILCLETYKLDSRGKIDGFIDNCFRLDSGRAEYIKKYSNGFTAKEIEDDTVFVDTDTESGSISDVLVSAQSELGGGRHINRNPCVYKETDEMFLGKWESSNDDLGESMIISMASPQAGGYHFEITRGDSVISYGDAYSSEGRLTLTQAFYHGDSMDGAMLISESGLNFGFGFTGYDKNGEYVGDGMMEFVRADD